MIVVENIKLIDEINRFLPNHRVFTERSIIYGTIVQFPIDRSFLASDRSTGASREKFLAERSKTDRSDKASNSSQITERLQNDRSYLERSCSSRLIAHVRPNRFLLFLGLIPVKAG